MMRAQREETAPPQAEASRGLDRALLAVASRVAAVARPHVEAAVALAQLEVEHAGDGVRAVLRRRAVAQHLHAGDGDARQAADVHAVRPEGAQAHHRAPMPPLAVHEHQRMVRIQPAQVRRTHERGPVGNGIPRHVERRHQRVDDIQQIRGLHALQVLGVERIHRHHRVGSRARLMPRANRHHHFLDGRRQVIRPRISGFLGSCAKTDQPGRKPSPTEDAAAHRQLALFPSLKAVAHVGVEIPRRNDKTALSSARFHTVTRRQERWRPPTRQAQPRQL